MSFQRPILNLFLRYFEKPHLARAAPDKLRSSLEAKARFWFRAPKGTQNDWKPLGAGRALWVHAPAADDSAVILYYHGGGYVFGSPQAYSAMLAQLAKRCGIVACLAEYRLAPEHPFPAAFDDAFAAYEALLADGIDASRIVIGGDSAGGGLALAVLGEILRQKAPLPAGVFAFSPLTDMTYSAPSVSANADSDVVLVAARAPETAENYLGKTGDRKDPRASPLFADFEGACPVWISVGDTEMLLDDTTRIAAHMKAQGVDVTTTVASDLPHVWLLFHGLLPEAKQTLDDVSEWIKRTLSAASGS